MEDIYRSLYSFLIKGEGIERAVIIGENSYDFNLYVGRVGKFYIIISRNDKIINEIKKMLKGYKITYEEHRDDEGTALFFNYLSEKLLEQIIDKYSNITVKDKVVNKYENNILSEYIFLQPK